MLTQLPEVNGAGKKGEEERPGGRNRDTDGEGGGAREIEQRQRERDIARATTVQCHP